MQEETIWVVTSSSADTVNNERGYRENSEQHNNKISVNELEKRMSRFLQSVSNMFRQAEQQREISSGISLEEIEISIEISGEGEIKLIGTGGKAGSKGAIKLRFKKLKNGTT